MFCSFVREASVKQRLSILDIVWKWISILIKKDDFTSDNTVEEFILLLTRVWCTIFFLGRVFMIYFFLRVTFFFRLTKSASCFSVVAQVRLYIYACRIYIFKIIHSPLKSNSPPLIELQSIMQMC